MRKMIKPDCIMNQGEMITYYQKFDPIEKKYGRYFNIYKNVHKRDKYDELYERCYQYENNRLLSDLTKKEFGDIYANLKLVYAEEKVTEEIIEIYDLIYDKVINQYLNIDGMERLFSENYINFEWEMHLGIDYVGHSMKFYRDHFIHQVRDAYSMDMLLKYGYAEKIMDILGNEGSSKISRYVCKHVNLQLECKEEILTDMKLNSDDERESRRKFYLENIIYMSSYMCALFHDIGYPEVANMQSGRNILAYIANVYNFGSGHIDFDRIITVLQNSLLFRVVSPKEIRGRIEDEKIDHGAVSALMFLLHFYENGAIYGLEPYKKCAIEIAGLAIYNHTNRYADILEGDDAEKALYNKCVFVLNPISYLLRICDDLQERDRIYFEISSNANIIYCSKCKTPLVRRKWKVNKVAGDDVYDVYYLCNCNLNKDEKINNEPSGVFSPVFRRGNFPYRRLYNVTVCTDMKFYQKNNRNIFILNYDLERLLNVAYINPSYAKYRIKELNQLKRMFVRQDIEEMTYIKYFMSANILFIKAYIVGEYLVRNISKRGLSMYTSHAIQEVKPIAEKADELFSKTELSEKLHACIKRQSKKIYKLFNSELGINAFEAGVKKYLNNSFWIYIYLYLVMRIGMQANGNTDKKLCKRICEGIEKLWELFKSSPQFTDDTLYLLKDCCKQATRMYRDEDLFCYNDYPDKYFKQFSSDKGIEDYFYRFVHSDNYQPVNHRNSSKDKNKLDAYTDLYLFKWILQKELVSNQPLISR